MNFQIEFFDVSSSNTPKQQVRICRHFRYSRIDHNGASKKKSRAKLFSARIWREKSTFLLTSIDGDTSQVLVHINMIFSNWLHELSKLLSKICLPAYSTKNQAVRDISSEPGNFVVSFFVKSQQNCISSSVINSEIYPFALFRYETQWTELHSRYLEASIRCSFDLSNLCVFKNFQRGFFSWYIRYFNNQTDDVQDKIYDFYFICINF